MEQHGSHHVLKTILVSSHERMIAILKGNNVKRSTLETKTEMEQRRIVQKV